VSKGKNKGGGFKGGEEKGGVGDIFIRYCRQLVQYIILYKYIYTRWIDRKMTLQPVHTTEWWLSFSCI